MSLDHKNKLYIIHKGKKIYITSLKQLKELQNQSLLNKLKIAVLRALNLKL
tara:strand:+ start:624 stop:776 length:153 start_codon:yes stop_codon:yes gene_type:complete